MRDFAPCKGAFRNCRAISSLRALKHFISFDCRYRKEKRLWQKGKKWYYCYYVDDASGNLVQKECIGTESKVETEKLLRKAMEEYESKKIMQTT